MDEERKKTIVTKVSKLLAKAQNTTFEHEAQAFLMKAQEVLAAHGLTMAEIEALTEQEQRDLVTKSEPYLTGTTARVSDWLSDLSVVIAKNFRCRVYFGHKYNKQTGRYDRTVVFMGMGTDAQIARDVFAAAVKVADRLSKEYVKTVDEESRATTRELLRTSWWDEGPSRARVSKQLRLAFLGGFISGLAARFESQKKADPSMALILVIHPLVNEVYDADVTGKPWKRTSNYKGSQTARAAGFQAGKDFSPEASTAKRLGGGR